MYANAQTDVDQIIATRRRASEDRIKIANGVHYKNVVNGKGSKV